MEKIDLRTDITIGEIFTEKNIRHGPAMHGQKNTHACRKRIHESRN